jgi:hypothetical protein
MVLLHLLLHCASTRSSTNSASHTVAFGPVVNLLNAAASFVALKTLTKSTNEKNKAIMVVIVLDDTVVGKTKRQLHHSGRHSALGAIVTNCYTT